MEKQDNKIKEISEKLENGTKELFESNKYAEYLKFMSKFHKYSFNNSLLISLQKPNATMVASFTSWQKNFKRNVKKGEKGIKIIAPTPYKIKKEVEIRDKNTGELIIGDDGKPIKKNIDIELLSYRVVSVFDVSQTDGEPIKEIVSNLTDNVKDYESFFNAIKDISPVPIEFKPINSNANGYYDMKNKVISIKENLSQAHTLKTSIHELAHALLHDKDNDYLNKWTKEVQAESIAYTVCNYYGIDTSDYSFGYIAGWSSNKSLEELKNSMELIRKTSSEIIKSIDQRLTVKEVIKNDCENIKDRDLISTDSFLDKIHSCSKNDKSSKENISKNNEIEF